MTPTVVTLLLIISQHHGHPQADTGGAAGDQHHFLPGSRHGRRCLSPVCHTVCVCVCAAVCQQLGGMSADWGREPP